ncbi:hypothetical protein C8035_v008524 [Colletotrichum spinosum]|uniref:Uncharacterized protein n=1 Tax=Colletotrichum spinosum TaxID=1347390 RepID=A0A4R8Q049_9PEZI|nr:hypothetical protein C8035_v008524 [Colletotrichum spinosum]
MIPYFDVSHLPSSASFYSAIFQPLGIHYISTGTQTAGGDPRTTIAFGTSSTATPVFQIREARSTTTEPLKLSRAVFSAKSPTAVTDFHACALRANPASHPLPLGSVFRPATPSGDTHRASATDLDGNIMEVVYQAPPSYPFSHFESTFRETQDQDGTSRILHWNYGVAGSETSSTALLAMNARSGHLAGHEPYTLLRRSVTTSVIESPSAFRESTASAAAAAVDPPLPSPASATASAVSNGLQTGTVVGSLLGAAVGVAAGAALTYGMMKKERAQVPLQEFDPRGSGSGSGSVTAPSFQRRATFPDQYADPRAAPGRYVEVERTVEKIRYPEAYPTPHESRASPHHMAKYNQVGARSRALDDLDDDGRSRHSSRYQLERGSSVHPRSQATVLRAAPLMLTDHEHQSSVGSRHSVAGRSAVPRSAIGLDPNTFETGTYISARSVMSQSTVRPPPPTVETELAFRSNAPSRAPTQAPTVVPSRAPTKAPSRAPTVAESRASTKAPSRGPSTTPSHAPSYAPSKVPSMAPTRAPSYTNTAVRVANTNPVFAYPPATRAPTYVSAHKVAVPRSGVGSRQTNWEDDAISVAPSDSISCIGSRTSRRQYHGVDVSRRQ